MASTSYQPPPSSSHHIIISVWDVTIHIPTSTATAQQAPPTVVLTGPTGQDATVRTKDASIDEVQQVAPRLQPAHEEVGAEAEVEARETDRA